MTKTKNVEVRRLDGTIESAYGRTWEVQKRPWTKPLPFLFEKIAILSYIDTRPPGSSGAPEAPSWYPYANSEDLNPVLNKAYDQFVNACHATAQNANNILEMDKTIASVAKHANSLRLAYEGLKHGDPGAVSRALGVSLPQGTKRKIVKRSQQASDTWLELHFGWEPLVQDIGNSIDAIQKPKTIKQKVRSSASGTYGQTTRTDGPAGWNEHTIDRNTFRVRIKMSAQVSVSNPNFALANQLGFVNPLSVAWEAVPFSFVVDWFSNVGQVISSLTDFVGYNIDNAYTTSFTQAHRSFEYQIDRTGSPEWYFHWDFNVQSQYTGCRRSLGIPAPKLALKPFHGFSPARGATAIALLLQSLKS